MNSRKVRPRARPSPTPVYGRQVPYNQDLAGILNSIPPVYDDVSVHYNYPDGRPRFPNKRQRRDVADEDGTIDEDDDEEATIDVVDGIPEVNTPVDDADIVARQVAQEYAVWYERTYLPWYNAMMGELEERRSYMPWFMNEGEEDDESEELMSEEHNEAVEQMALYKALLQNMGDDDEGQVSEGDDQSNEGEGDDQAILDSFNLAMQQLQENYLAMLQTGEDEGDDQSNEGEGDD